MMLLITDSSYLSRRWHTRPEYVARTNAVIKRIASQVKDMAGVAPIIAPLNEWVELQTIRDKFAHT